MYKINSHKMMVYKEFIISVSNNKHIAFSREIELLMEQAASEKSIGLALQNGQYIGEKMINGDAIIATKQGRLAGFCYLKKRDNEESISISGVVVVRQYRKMGVAKAMIKELFEVARVKYPMAKIFSLTTSPEVMRVNSTIGHKPVSFTKLSMSNEFWSSCKDCSNYSFLQKNGNTRCLCSAMLFNPFSLNIEDEYQLNEQAVINS